MRMIKRGILIILPLVVALLVPALALAQPEVCGFYGSVSSNGMSVADDTVVSAWIDETKVAECPTTSSQYGLAPNTLRIAGQFGGKVVHFKVGIIQATQTAVWEKGTNVKLDLTAFTPTPTPTPTPTATTTPTPTPTPTPGGYGCSASLQRPPNGDVPITGDAVLLGSLFTGVVLARFWKRRR
jgi:hypothetical protein